MVPRDVHCEGFDLTYTRIANDGCATTSPTSSTNSSSGIHNNNNHNNNLHPGGTVNSHTTHGNTTTTDPTKSTTHSNNTTKPVKSHFLDQKVDDAIEIFLRKSLTQIGPELLSVSSSCK